MAEPIVLWERDLPEYNGKWSWDRKTLFERMKSQKPDFDANDPATWFRIKDLTIMQALYGTECSSSAISRGMFYRRPFVYYDLKTLKSIKLNGTYKRTTVDSENMNSRFLHYPYRFDSLGKMGRFKGMTATEYNIWVEAVTGEPAKPLKISNVANLEPPRDDPADYTATIDRLKDELKESQENQENVRQIEATQERARAAEQTNEALRNQYANELKQVSERTENRVKDLKEQLSDAKKDTAQANQRIMSLSDAIKRTFSWANDTQAASTEQSDVSSQKKRKHGV
ncbi:hypothetical protein BS50DRAFT_672479 [Corynespora cassiicola Philippines]|uniref:Uncharacterized protein n=1 Tax=Corynespora cassiicola Philippines TaxID=1448308 RepID=A0A2T2P7K7_CORCC|nr:hypothetical protein BS50DRAFT_672479 [Corynespora cassiicola Philippines]